MDQKFIITYTIFIYVVDIEFSAWLSLVEVSIIQSNGLNLID